MNDWTIFGIFFTIILGALVLLEKIKTKYIINTEIMRKFVHVSVGMMIMSTPFIFQSKYPPLTLAIFFFILNFAAIKKNLLKAIHGIDRKSYGTVYFPLTFILLCIFYWDKPVIFLSSLGILTFSDTIASIIGGMDIHKSKVIIWEDTKSSVGSLAMFLSSMIIIFMIIQILLPEKSSNSYLILFISIITAIGATIGEAVSKEGSDNLTAPLLTALLLDICLRMDTSEVINLFIWSIASLVIFYYLVKLKVLKLNGMISAYLMGIVIFGIGGSAWIIPMITFFLSSSILSRLSPGQKSNKAKGSERDMFQVFANGGIPMIIAIFYFYTGIHWLYLVYLAGVAAANADTWATEIGAFSRKEPRLITSFEKVPKGSSGAVSLIGTLGSISGAILIALTGYLFGLSIDSLLLVVLVGTVGSLVDSLVGATAQSIFECSECNKLTEKRIHCNAVTSHKSGIIWIDNDMVNFINTGASTILLFMIRIFI